MLCFELDVAFDFISERTQADAWKSILCPVMKTVNPSKVAFRDQLRFGRQPVLHIVPGLRTLVDIIEVWPFWPLHPEMAQNQLRFGPSPQP